MMVGWRGFRKNREDYWFYVLNAGYQSSIRQGRTTLTCNGALMHIATDFLRPESFGKSPLRRVWHMRLALPSPPDFDRTCPSCKGHGETGWRTCHDCRGKGQL